MDLEKLSKLARVEIGKKESQKLNDDLAGILRYIDKLKEAPVEKTEVAERAGGPENVWREDRPQEFKDYENLVKAAPHREKEYVKVKPVK